MPTGCFAWRVACYESFGWTPDECKEVLHHYPMECDLLSVYFEELAAFRGEQYAEMTSKQGHYEEPGWTTDSVFDSEE